MINLCPNTRPSDALILLLSTFVAALAHPPHESVIHPPQESITLCGRLLGPAPNPENSRSLYPKYPEHSSESGHRACLMRRDILPILLLLEAANAGLEVWGRHAASKGAMRRASYE